MRTVSIPFIQRPWTSKKQGLVKIRLWATSGYHDVSGITSQSFETSENLPKFGHVSLPGYVRIFLDKNLTKKSPQIWGFKC